MSIVISSCYVTFIICNRNQIAYFLSILFILGLVYFIHYLIITFAHKPKPNLIHGKKDDLLWKGILEEMFTYYYRILDKYNRPISAYAIFTDAVKTKRPDRYERTYQGTHLSYRFNTYQLALQDEAELLKNDNPFALAVLVGITAFVGNKIRDSGERDGTLLQFKIQLLRKLVAKKTSNKKIRALMNFLKYYIHFENNDNNVKFPLC